MYRILYEHSEVKERRNQLCRPVYRRPELLATGPNQLWTWDITKLRRAVKWQYYYLYVVLGGWEERPERPPGKLILTRGLRRILDMLATEAILNHYVPEHGDLPPFVKRLLANR